MSEHAPDRVWSGIDIPKTIAGVLAAVSAAVVGSFLGVAGTLAGAAVASIVGSIGTEVYRKFIDRGHKKIVATFVTAPAAVGTPTVAAAAGETPSQPEPEPAPAAGATTRKMRWGRVAALAAGVFVLAIGTLTAFELITGKSASEAVGVHSNSTTTVGSLVHGGDDKTGPATTPASEPASTAPATARTGEPASTSPAVEETAGATPSPAPPRSASPEPATTDTQTGGDGGSNRQNHEAPPATGQPPATK